MEVSPDLKINKISSNFAKQVKIIKVNKLLNKENPQ